VFISSANRQTEVETTLALQVRKLYRWIRPFFSAGESGASPPSPPHGLTEHPRSGFSGHDLNAPTLHLSHFGPFLALRKRPELRADKPATAASIGWRSGHSGTHLGATGGTQTHSRRTGSKL